ncbi:MAG: hypothetical protein EAZ97_05615 [Bacteroidetes bacterium]|nr:MAG: hypothetical protein EAZ97_05615 [Bacteroidota bacterium]
MCMLKRYFLFGFLCLFANHIFAQNWEVIKDLEQSLAKTTQDSVKIKILNDLAWEFADASFERSKDYAEKSMELAEDADFAVGQAWNLRLLGYLDFRKGEYGKALENYKTAIEIFDNTQNKSYVAQILNDIATVHFRLGNYTKNLEYALKSLKINEEILDQRGIADNDYNIGRFYLMAQKNYTECLNYYEKALAIRKKLNIKKDICESLNNIGVCYGYMEEYDKAIEYFNESLLLAEELNNEQFKLFLVFNIGYFYMKQDKFEEALAYLGNAKQISLELDSKAELSFTLNTIAIIYLKSNQLKLAQEYSLQALEVAQSIGAKPRQQDAYKNLYEIYKKEKKTELALKYYEMSMNLKDSIFNEEKAKAITNLQTGHEIDKKQSEIELLKSKSELEHQAYKAQTVQRNAFILGFLLILVLAFILLRFNRKEKQNNSLLQHQNVAIKQQQQELLATNEALEHQKEIVEHQKEVLEETSNRLSTSIRYAQNIQQVILPEGSELDKFFENQFVIFLPKDIVSGDFYWFSALAYEQNKGLLVLADCTGHGVPGAFMTMVGNTLLHEMVDMQQNSDPAKILYGIHTGVQNALKQKEGKNSDGMDVSVCLFNKKDTETEIVFAGAKSSMFYVENGEVIRLSGNKSFIGGKSSKERIFTNQIVSLPCSTSFYLSTDGYIDQNNLERRSIGTEGFTKILHDIQGLGFSEQQKVLLETLQKHQGNEPQRDDISVVAVEC